MVVSCGHSFGGLMLRTVIERVSMTISCSLQKLCPIIASLKSAFGVKYVQFLGAEDNSIVYC
jgi:hypothetical protein